MCRRAEKPRHTSTDGRNTTLVIESCQSVYLKVDVLAIIKATHTWQTFGKIILVDIYKIYNFLTPTYY